MSDELGTAFFSQLGQLRAVQAVGVDRAAVDLETMRWLGPGIVATDVPVGVTRDQVSVPISPQGTVDDTVLFEDPADPGRHFYLPRYRLRVSDAGRYEITTELVDGQWRMTFGLESYPAEEIAATVADAAILPHELAFGVSSGTELTRDYPVAESSPGTSDTLWRPEIVLVLTLAERDALLHAFTRDEEHARIEVRRSITVAVPVGPSGPAPFPDILVAVRADDLGTPVILPDLVMADVLRPVPRPVPEETGGVVVAAGTVGMVEAAGGLRQQVVVNRDFLRSAVVTDGGLRRLTFQEPRAPGILRRADPGPEVAATDAGPDIAQPEIAQPFRFPGPGAPQRFSVVSSVQVAVVGLRFDVETHPYLFPAGQPTGGGSAFATLVVAYPAQGPASTNHVYFHDETAGNVFYHLPDAFLVGRRGEPPYGPELSFTVGRTTAVDPGSDGGDAGAAADDGAPRAVALMSVHLVPQTSPARLYDAALALAAHVTAGSGEPELRPAVHPATCRLELPGGAVTTSSPPDLVNGSWIAESFGFEDLRDVYAVLTAAGAASALMRGRVDVEVMGQVHQVPVELRLDRLSSPPLSWSEEVQAEEVQDADAEDLQEVTLTLRNEGALELSVPPLRGWVSRGAAPVPAVVTGDLPVQLAPGASVAVRLRPETRPVGTGDSHAVLDLTPVRAVTDAEHAVEQTLDRRVARLPRVVTILTTEGGLGTTGDPERDLTLVGLQFAGVSGAVTLDHATLQRDIAVPVPLVDWLLDRGSGEFEYKQTLVHVSGTSVSDDDWRSVDTSLLVLPQPLPLPPDP